MWLVWKERNNCTCEDVKRLLDHLKSLLIRTLFDWSRVGGFTHCTSIFDFPALFLVPHADLIVIVLNTVHRREHRVLVSSSISSSINSYYLSEWLNCMCTA